ncbi:hypothetical protein GCM10011579_019450 [Streptomyces albiflavescens]|uniref:Uncharacterized protein n=1 Tax=Streptomyces albiflavescens TaxID=1623582 RepID=A0A917XWM9_9ACTN|nr:hypothetical protein [Streptomyces albiflavescens]GGN57329.1 hypothetical protein GCM10011579_019450 [Streptomyces albiflavescens]
MIAAHQPSGGTGDLRTTSNTRTTPSSFMGDDFGWAGPELYALAPCHDILIRLHRVEAARLRDR